MLMNLLFVLQRAADAAVLCPAEEKAEPWPQEKASVLSETPPQGQEGGTTHGET